MHRGLLEITLTVPLKALFMLLVLMCITNPHLCYYIIKTHKDINTYINGVVYNKRSEQKGGFPAFGRI